MVFAHSTPDPSRADWEPLATHLADVARRAACFAAAFHCEGLARVAGQLHDIGKMADAFQTYIAAQPEPGRRGPDHSTAGAREAARRYDPVSGRVLAYIIAGHHAGLADARELDVRLGNKPLPPYAGWEAHTDELSPEITPEMVGLLERNVHPGFTPFLLTRMLFSCLVDADRLATECFETGRERGPPGGLGPLQDRLAGFLAGKRHDDTPLNRLRARVLDHAVSRAGLEPGLFTLTVPTGGGKTLTSLAFALEHARRHGLRRVIYVIPYTSIIEQTASVFRDALGGDAGVLEHHASFDWERPRRTTEDADAEDATRLARLRQAAENWDAPVVVTTAVQFFESLFARQTSRCRKLHNIAGSVVVLDEAQTLPLRLLRPCMAAVTELAANYRTSVVLCTATQPALRECDGFTDGPRAPKQVVRKAGFRIDDGRELAPDPKALHTGLKRVEIVRRPGKTTDAEIAARFAEQPRGQMLCIVNSRRHARDLFDLLKADARTAEGARHLTTLMCPAHRRTVLAEVRRRLDPADPKPVHLVSTSLIEAGVDIDFPEVWRALAGLDSIAQAAGRCNREGRMERGQVVVFEPAEGSMPGDLVDLAGAADRMFGRGLDPLSLDGVREYFREVYWLRGAEAMDAGRLGKEVWPILEKLCERARTCAFDFETISDVFRLIDDAGEAVIVPYDDEAETILARVAAMDKPLAADLRRLQQYAVSIPKRERDRWLAAGVLCPVNRGLGDGLLRFHDRGHYRQDTGLDLRQPERRDAALNIV